jgi:WD40 repeat protein
LKMGRDWAQRVIFSPDSQTVATGGWDGKVCLWDASSGKRQAKLEWYSGCVNSLAFSPDGQTLFGVSGDDVKRWAVRGADPPAPLGLEHPDPPVWSVAVSPDGQTLVSGGSKGSLRVYDLARGAVRISRKQRGGIRTIAYSPDGQRLAVTVGRSVILYDTGKLAKRAILKGHRDSVISVAFTPDGRALVTASWDRTVRTWDATGRQTACWDWGIGRAFAVAVAPDGMTAAVGGEESVVVLWDLSEGA